MEEFDTFLCLLLGAWLESGSGSLARSRPGKPSAERQHNRFVLDDLELGQTNLQSKIELDVYRAHGKLGSWY